jgi:hypothetical protein
MNSGSPLMGTLNSANRKLEDLVRVHDAAWDYFNEINHAFRPESERYEQALRAAELVTLDIAGVRGKSIADLFAKAHAFRRLCGKDSTQAKLSRCTGHEYSLIASILSDLMMLETEGRSASYANCDARDPSDTAVSVNTSDTHNYGHAKQGAYMCEAAAKAVGGPVASHSSATRRVE